jgi:YD repeat-containing protein
MFARACSGLILLFASFQAAIAVDLWAVTIGVPGNGQTISDELFKYLDADAACQAEFQLPPPEPCGFTDPRNLRNAEGPQVQSTCTFDATNVCGTPYTTGYMTQRYTWKRTTTSCPAGTTLHLGECKVDTPKLRCDTRREPDLVKGNPCNIGSGNKSQSERVYGAGGGLEVVLTYNSQLGNTYFRSGPFGKHWSTRYTARVRPTGQAIVAVGRGDGRELEFRAPPSGNIYLTDADVNDRLEQVLNGSGVLIGWIYTAADSDEIEEYSADGFLLKIKDRAGRERSLIYTNGLLTSVTDHVGRQLTFTYNAQKRVATMGDPAAGLYTFEYDGASGPTGAGNLTKITFPDTKSRVYFYGEAAHINGGSACSTPSPMLPNALTGLRDEKDVRFATWTYDCIGRATSSEHAGGVERYSFTYNADERVVEDPLGTSRNVDVPAQRILGVPYSTGTSQPAASGTGTALNARTRDTQGNLSSRTDFNGNRTDYAYDLARNLETSRTEGLTTSGGTTPQTRTISTQWHATFRLPTGIAEPLRITTFAYDADGTTCGARGALCSKSIQATMDANGSQAFSATPSGSPRTWTYTYNANGSVLTVNGPRTDVNDVATYTYYANNASCPTTNGGHATGCRGQVETISNALSHTTSVTAYNAHGQPLAIVDPNGLTTTMTYDARQRLTSRIAGGETTTYEYDFAGQLTKVTLPDGAFLAYAYDDAHRLTQIQDNVGNKIVYTLDNIGNRTLEEVRDPANALVQTRSRVFNSLNRLFRELGAQSQTTEYSYDDQGNVLIVKDPLNHTTTNQYDALNRLKQVTSPSPVSAVTQYAYDGLDQLVLVTDPRSLVTGYTVNGLGNLTQLSSPDTGNTVSTHDAAGNLLTQTDAKSQTSTYTYDALNRVTSITFHDGSKHNYSYDAGTNGVGRLTGISELNPSLTVVAQIAYGYDQKGRLISEVRTINGVAYTTAYRYESVGRMDRITYPSGRTVDYSFDSLGRVADISTTPPAGSAQLIVSDVTYQPFGGVAGFTLGNGQTYARNYDQDGRAATYTLGGTGYTIGYDAASRIAFITQTANPTNTNTYGYDSLDRLTSATLPATVYGYDYDAVGNRVTRSTGGSSHTYAYAATSNRISSITPTSGPVRNFTFDNNGSTTADGNNTYGYDTRGRMVQAVSSLGTTTYQVNALGQRIRKTNSLGDTIFHYDAGGRLIAETGPTGTLKREFIYLGDIPVGVAQ